MPRLDCGTTHCVPSRYHLLKEQGPMILILSKDTLATPTALELRTVPKQVFGRSVIVLPRGLIAKPVFWRIVAEHALFRYLVALTPFPVAMFIWPHLALPISQAPLLMFIAIWFFESRVLSVPKDKRPDLADADEIGRVRDLLRLRSKTILAEIASGRKLTAGELHLVVEQAEMRLMPPLTYISVQTETPEPRFLDLTEDERALIESKLFDEDLTEARLLDVNFAESTFLRDTVLDPAQISAHARMQALMEQRRVASGTRA